jgi:drug/metabolite transporter (DMT)-like permease
MRAGGRSAIVTDVAERYAAGSGTIDGMTDGLPAGRLRNSRASALVSLHAAVALFGFAGLFGKWIDLPPAAIVLGRTVVAAIALGATLALRRQFRGGLDWRLGVNGTLLALHWVAFFQAIQTAGVAIGLLGFATFPAFVLILEWIFLRRRTQFGDWLLVGITILGLVLIVPEFRLSNSVLQGVLWGALAGATFALLAVGNRALTSLRNADEIAFWQNAVAATCLLPALPLLRVTPSLRDLGLILLLGLICTAVAHTLFIRSLRVLSAHTASVVATMEPVYGIALAALLLGERPTTATLTGGAIIVGAALWATLSAPRT